MLRKLLVGTTALAIATVGMATVTAGVAGAGKPTIVAGPGSSINCNITATAKLSPSLKNDWVKSDHSTDPVAAVAALANQVFASNGPVIVTVKGKGTCTGTVTDGVNTASVTSVKFSLSNDPAHPGNSSEASCSALVTGNPPSTAEYNVTISYKSGTAKVANTTVTDAVIPPTSFSVSGGTLSGSFAGGTSTASGVPDATTVDAVLQAAPTSANPVPTYRQCQPSLSIKVKKGVTTASLKAPKGLKKVLLVSGSTLAVSR